MQSQPGDKYANCFVLVDGTWNTRGAAAPHGGVTLRSFNFWGALLGSETESRKNPDDPSIVTSCSFERIALRKLCKRLVVDGLGSQTFEVAGDNDVKTFQEMQKHWEDLIAYICSGI